MLALLVKYKLAVIAAALLGAVGLGGVGVAAANGALPLNVLNTLQLQQATPGSATQRGHDGRARHILHGTVILQANGAWVTYTLDAGSVTAASSSAITLKRADGSSATLAVTASTLWGPNGKAAPKNLARLIGREVAVLSQNGAAVHIGGRGMFKGFAYVDLTLYRNGKTRKVQLDRGVVKSVSATQISLTRADGVALTLTLSPKVRYHQAGTRGPAPASIVKSGANAVLLVYNNQVVGVRVAAAAQ